MTKVYKAYKGRKFLIPDELDILVSFSPIKNEAGSDHEFSKSPNGGFKIKV